MKLIIHCGRSKTGTSSLQASLNRGRDILKKYGILYYTGKFSNHNPLAKLVGKKGRPTEDESEALLAQAENLFSEIHDRMSGGRFSHLLLSAEYMENFSAKQYLRLLDMLGINPDSTAVIMYIRSPHAMYLSRMQQQIKADHLLLKPKAYRDDTLECIENWTRTVGAGNLNVRLFSPDRLYGGDIVADFQRVLNEQFDFGLTGLTSSRENASLSSESVATLQQYRKICCSAHPRTFLNSSNHLIKTLFEIESENQYRFSKPRLKDDVIAEIYKNNAEVVKTLDERYPHLGFSSHCLTDLEHAPSRSPNSHRVVDSQEFADIVKEIDRETLAVLPFVALDRTIKDYLAARKKSLVLQKLRAQVNSLQSRLAAVKKEEKGAEQDMARPKTRGFEKFNSVLRRLAGKIMGG
ncbi:MAG: hypothetical protein ACLFNW_09535 [Desulfobacterales bacterium]